MTSALAVAAASWAILMALGPLLQVRLILARRSSRGVSISYFFILLVGFLLWIAYGIAIAKPALVIPNVFAVATALTTIAVALRFR